MINNNFLEVEEVLKDFLQQDLVLRLNKQFYKRGKLILFNKNYFIFNFILKTVKKNKPEILKIPFPFDFYRNNGSLIFEYKINNFLKNDEVLISEFDRVKKETFSKFYDKILEIEVYNGK